ncbi:glutaredoxin family protein [Gaetbulibacter sp. M235]|uniref:glutaredoxin family protein n=1 Tax=Gaetbulibacter sp. M235 TaxID=3126510 RepID=UPI00374ED795
MKYFTLSFFLISLNANIFQEKKTIIVYGSDTCHYCIDTKAYLKEKKVAFIYFDVDVNLEKQQEMIAKLQKAKIDISSLSLPVIDKKGEIFTNGEDFDKFLKRIIQ